MGRHRKPTSILKLEGKYHPSRHGDRAGEPVAEGQPTKPGDLPTHAEEHWDNVVQRLVDMGVAKKIDTPALVEMCYWYDRCCNLRGSESQDYKALTMAACANKQWLALASRFGLTPCDRARLDVRESVDDPAAEFMA